MYGIGELRGADGPQSGCSADRVVHVPAAIGAFSGGG